MTIKKITFQKVHKVFTPLLMAISMAGFAQTYEFETGTLSGNANVQGCDSCSGSLVGNLGGDGSVSVNVTISTAGWYNLQLFYATNDPRTIRLTAGTASTIAVPCEPSGGWSTASSKNLQVYLNAGTTALLWDSTVSWAPNLDKFVLTPLGTPQTQSINFGTNSQIVYDLANKTYNLYFNGVKVVTNASSNAYGNQNNVSSSYTSAAYSSESFTDNIGSGTKHIFTLSGGFTNNMQQVFYTYIGKDYLAIQVALTGAGANCYKMIPLTSYQVSPALGTGDTRAVFVPYDNDAWIRYNAFPLNAADFTASEVSNIYNNDNHKGFVIGSIDHNHWKTGITVSGGSNQTAYVQVIAGWMNQGITRDQRGHGWVSVGQELCESPKIMINANDDWRTAFEEYGQANAAMHPKFVADWTASKPMGWNSWGAMQTSINLQKTKDVVDFFADDCPAYRTQDGTLYIDLDSYWDNMTDTQLAEFAAYCHTKGFKAGIYWAPFVDWGKWNRSVEGSSYQYEQCWTKVNGNPIELDGAYAIDPTHPATKERINYFVDRFKAANFDMIKIDFITHASLEADSYYNNQIHTGMEAYKEGMEYLINAIGDEMLVYAAISPNMATGPYANMRRIACDAYSSIGDTDYTLNSTNYGWWQNEMYDYIDADHIVFGNVSDGQNKARLLSSIVTGTIISGDDYSVSGPWVAKSQNYLQNMLVMNAARKELKWRPVDGNSGNNAGRLFYAKDGSTTYLAVFNYQNTSAQITIDAARIGLTAGTYNVQELYGNMTTTFSDALSVTIPASDAALYSINYDIMDRNQLSRGTALGYAYPNPAGDYINIHFATAINETAQFDITDLSGKTVWSGNLEITGSESPEIDVKQLPQGFYILSVIQSGKEKKNYKFIKG